MREIFWRYADEIISLSGIILIIVICYFWHKRHPYTVLTDYDDDSI